MIFKIWSNKISVVNTPLTVVMLARMVGYLRAESQMESWNHHPEVSSGIGQCSMGDRPCLGDVTE